MKNVKQSFVSIKMASTFSKKHYIYHIRSGVEEVSISLMRFSYSFRLGDHIPKFGCPVLQLSMIASKMSSFVYDIYHEKLISFQKQWLAL